MSYETLSNENILLYKSLARSTAKLDNIKKVFNNFNFFDTNSVEMFSKLLKIYEIMEE